MTVWPDYILRFGKFLWQLIYVNYICKSARISYFICSNFWANRQIWAKETNRISFDLLMSTYFFGANASENRNALAYCESWGGVFKNNRLKGKTKNNIPQFQKGGVVFWLSGCLDPKKSPKWTLQKIPQCQRIVSIGS